MSSTGPAQLGFEAGLRTSDQPTRCMIQVNSYVQGEAQNVGLEKRWRELFPVPLCSEVPREAGLSTSARRRRAKVWPRSGAK